MHTHRWLLTTFGAGLLATLLMSGMAQAGSENDQGSSADNDNVVEIEMISNRFEPEELEVSVGTTVRWVNVERRSNHDIYFPEEDIASGRLFPEESWERTFDEEGTYEYYCQPHQDRGMVGVIRVVADE
ncbi:cupredoxin domain-containing protein [Billgrantia kenyensis]|uniref:Cupredoxin domain-containing protein n=1 Tax=Billgrantia kenyensis TaxID=321266 RepID=A0A7V9VYZ0_9GAMM|nr:plastocyanin/azurin family copper-binding protein [Halomonas kenyensis]MBA2778023.1 cupredoxin domain-containing protein [Halomonas kenyensis]MCG6661494.1 plastocyanin [Halomonas kenyensis]